MAVPRFYHPDLAEGRVSLSGAQSAHARKSRRLRPGDRVELFDGAGRIGPATITETPPAGAVIVAVERIETVAPDRPQLVLATALPKAARQDYLIEKCTEIGVNRFQPVVFDRSIVKPNQARLDKWRRTAIEAAKQSHRAWLPEFDPPVRFEQWIEGVGRTRPAYYAHTAGDSISLIALLPRDLPGVSVLITIGPEGGFTGAEIEGMQSAGMTPASLGPNVLRIETAATAAAIVAAWRPTTTASKISPGR